MKAYAENNKIYFNYEVVEKYEAGIELYGNEVKSIRTGKMSLEGSFVIVRGGEMFLINSSVQPYQVKNTSETYNPLRNRKLLLTKKEISVLGDIEKNKSLTIVPISVYNKNRKIKCEIAVVKGKKKFDKRETIKKRETDRMIRRDFKLSN